MKKEAFIHGFYPHSPSLITINRGVDRGRFSQQELVDAQTQDLIELKALQKEERLAFVEDGKFIWQDIFRPLIHSTTGLEEGPLTRWNDTNTFYRKLFRQPIVARIPELNHDKFDRYLTKIDGVEQKITLPSPYIFAKVCDDLTASGFDQTFTTLSEYLGDVIGFAYSKGISAVQLNESYLPYVGATKKDIDTLVGALEKYSKLKNADQKLFVHFDFGDAAPILRELDGRELDVDGIGIDCYKTILSEIPTNISRPLIAGVINSQNSSIESVDEVNNYIDDLSNHANPSIIYLTNSSDLSYVPKYIADQKVKVLGEISLL